MMRQTWRWFGPVDRVTLQDARQAGAQGIVTALMDLPPGDIWPLDDIAARRTLIGAAGLTWDVVESLPVSEAIRSGGPQRDAHIENWIASLKNLAQAGIPVICYNFMPVLDWTRTDLVAQMPSGATALRFDLIDFAAFDLHVLQRNDAHLDYPDDIIGKADAAARRFLEEDRERLTANVLAGLPGAVESWTLETLRERLAAYGDADADTLRANLAYFLKAVVPEAERLGLRLCCHPDDPPWPLLGLPRVVSTEEDYAELLESAPSAANGITFCTGSLGARADNDLPGMIKRLGPHIHFLHLRNVKREAETLPCSFHEDEHLAGSTDMIAVIRAILAEQARRKREGREDWCIAMRPDHGQDILDDQARRAAPGYPAIGRLKGLAELRGAMMALYQSEAP